MFYILKAEKNSVLFYKIILFPGFDLHLLITAVYRSGNISIQKPAPNEINPAVNIGVNSISCFWAQLHRELFQTEMP